jgi:two-component system sensor histidine kinase ChvG
MRHDRHEVAIELVIDKTGPMVIEGIPGRLGQVIDNLLTNALSFSPPGSTITVSLSRHGQDALLWVDDEGIGIPAGSEEKVFSRFYSQRPEAEAFGEHSGLGLSIVRQIVEAHGGAIHAENRAAQLGGSQGARFVIVLPLSK